jgi:hypothetical protein
VNQTPDPQRLEDGLRQLRELGYLHTPASAYVARQVGGRRSIVPAILASSLWIGGGTGLVFSLLMVASAVFSDTGLLRFPRSVLLLFFQLALVLSLIFAAVTGVFSAATLLLQRRGAKIRGSATERALVLVPGLLATVYLVDRVGRALLEGADPAAWGTEAVLLVAFAGFFAAALSGAMRGALAMVRLQLHGAWSPRQIGGLERAMPAIAAILVSIVLLASGPYRPGDRLPWFEEVEVSASVESERLIVIGIDGLSPGSRPAGSRSGVARPEGTGSPTGYWNEISTGFAASEHGLVSPSTSAPRGWNTGGERLREDPVLGTLVTRLMPGIGLTEQHAADRRELRRPPVWEIVARAGQRARVVNWWGSYPSVRSPNLEVVSDRQWLRHISKGQPDSLLASPEYMLLDAEEFDRMLSGFADELADSGIEVLLDSLEAPPEFREVFRLAATADRYHLERAAVAALEEGAAFVAVLLSGPDILMRAGDGMEGWGESAALRLRREYAQALLEAVESRFAHASGSTWVIGVERDAGGGVSDTWGIGPWPERPSESAALMLEALGVPAALDMAGAGEGGPVTYGLLRPDRAHQPRVAPDLEQLRSLGYIGD